MKSWWKLARHAGADAGKRSAVFVLVETNGAFLGFLARAKDTCASYQVA